MRPSILIKDISFCNGEKINISEEEILIIVGPNNSGKSATLRGIQSKLGSSKPDSPIVKGVSFERIGSLEDLNYWLQDKGAKGLGDGVARFLGATINEALLSSLWKVRSLQPLKPILRWFCNMLTAEERLGLCKSPKNINILMESPAHPIQTLVADVSIELRLSDEFRRAFGTDLVVHRNAGSEIPLLVGERPKPDAGEDRLDVSYMRKLALLPTLESQGDGMKSFAGILLAASVGDQSVLLIDEPEAFLHPPQAYMLASNLVRRQNLAGQLFIATHSADFLRGALDSGNTSVRVMRISRNGSTNKISLLENNKIREIWGDPLLRYSNIFDGLFHEGVVICESDGDCRFYGAILNEVVAAASNERKTSDLLFTHCGGKHRLPVVIRALKEVSVPVTAVADFDVLSDKESFKAIVEAFGSDWESVSKDWQIVKSQIESKKSDLSKGQIKVLIDEVFAKPSETQLSSESREEIRAALKRASPWAMAKSGGKAMVPAGDATQACVRLLTALRTMGLFVVEVGEVEGFAKSIGGHGPKWVNAVMQRPLATDPELKIAREFVLDIVDFFESARGR